MKSLRRWQLKYAGRLARSNGAVRSQAVGRADEMLHALARHMVLWTGHRLAQRLRCCLVEGREFATTAAF